MITANDVPLQLHQHYTTVMLPSENLSAEKRDLLRACVTAQDHIDFVKGLVSFQGSLKRLGMTLEMFVVHTGYVYYSVAVHVPLIHKDDEDGPIRIAASLHISDFQITPLIDHIWIDCRRLVLHEFAEGFWIGHEPAINPHHYPEVER